MLKVRIRFSKTGALIYIGHLDVMRYFQKLFRRARIPVAYSEGFSPHQVLSFTPPLPLGMESTGEYADVTLTEGISTREALDSLCRQSVPEIEIMSFRKLPEKCENAMAAVRASQYAIYHEPDMSDIIRDAISSLMSLPEINVLKKTKKNEKIVNIRDLIYDLREDDNGGCVNMLISSGSSDNLKPQIVMEELVKLCKTDCPYEIKRIDQFTYDNGYVSLDAVGKDIS